MTAPELVEVVAKALYRSVVSFPGELHPTLSELPKHQQDKYRDQARAVLAALTEAGSVEWGVLERPTMAVTLEMTQRIVHPVSKGNAFDAVRTKGSVYTGVVSRLTLPWTAVE